MRLATWCSGIGAPEQAVAGLGWTHHSVAEIDTFASAVLAHHFPGVPNLGDLTAPDFLPRFLALGIPDVIVAGTPCQAFSVAGLRRGLDDLRGNLTLLALQLLEAITDAARSSGQRPPVFVWENVPGALSDSTNAFGCLLAGLVGHDSPLEAGGKRGGWPDAGMASGPARRAAWRILDAQYFGLAQRRARVFLVASAGDGPDPAQVLLERAGVRRHPPARPGQGEDATRRAGGGADIGGGADDRGGAGHGGGDTEFLSQSSRVYRPDQAAPTLQSTGDNDGNRAPIVLAPAVAFGGNRTSGPIDVAPSLLAQPGSGYKGDFDSETFIMETAHTLKVPSNGAAWRGDGADNLVAHTLRGEGFDASEDGTGRGTPLVAVAAPLTHGGAPNSNAPGRRKEDDTNLVAHIAPTLQAGVKSAGSATQQDAERGMLVVAPRPTVIGFHGSQDPDVSGDITHPVGRTQGFNTCIAFDPTQITHPANRSNPQPGGTSHSLAAAARPPHIASTLAVRRLTPTECERLQGCRDGFTDILHRGKPAADGPRYRALGNSMAVPVMRWILTRLKAGMAARRDGTMPP